MKALTRNMTPDGSVDIDKFSVDFVGFSRCRTIRRINQDNKKAIIEADAVPKILNLLKNKSDNLIIKRLSIKTLIKDSQ